MSILNLNRVRTKLKGNDYFYKRLKMTVNNNAINQLTNAEISLVIKVIEKEFAETVRKLKNIQSQQ